MTTKRKKNGAKFVVERWGGYWAIVLVHPNMEKFYIKLLPFSKVARRDCKILNEYLK